MKKRLWNAAKYGVLVLLSIWSLFPFAWMLITSLKPESEVYAVPPIWIPSRVTGEHYVRVLRSQFPRAVVNSTVIALAVTFLVLLLSSLAAYGFTRFRFRGNRALLLSSLFGHFLPEAVRFFPLYMFFLCFGLVNTHQSLVLTYISVLLPISIWTLTGYFQSIPEELDEAAMIDGCSRLRILFRIVLPLASPGLISVGVFCFIWAWQEFLFALVLINDPEKRTIALALAQFLGQYYIDWGGIMAATTITVLPTTIVFVLFQKWLVAGLTKGALKG
ncbi:carbohydrate ABC transporter permease [Candidatus Bipolaricaulota bacterium]|nr:carbohydrate ABC transporter permease [Candidatus Bipolaricaulota bacterium]